MASLTLKQVTCALHVQDNAVLFCKHHRELLCLSCVTEKKHTEKDCSLINMNEIKQKEGNDSLVIECLQLRQLVKQRQKKRVEFCEVYDSLKEKMLLNVKNAKESLLEKIETLAKSSEKAVIDGISDRKRDLENEANKLDEFQLKLDDLINKLESRENDETKNTDSEFRKIAEEFKNKSEFRERSTIPCGNFNPLEVIAKLKRSPSLGQVWFECDEAYASIEDVMLPDTIESKDNKEETVKTDSENKICNVEDNSKDKQDKNEEHDCTQDTDPSKTNANTTNETTKEGKKKPRYGWFFGKKKSADLTKESKVTES